MTRQESLIHWVKFLIGGGINTVFTYGLYFGLHVIMPYQAAYALAFAVGIVFSYFFNAIIVFNSRIGLKSFFAFPLVYLLQYLLSAFLLGVFVERLGISQSIAPVAIIILTIPITFGMTRWFLRRV